MACRHWERLGWRAGVAEHLGGLTSHAGVRPSPDIPFPPYSHEAASEEALCCQNPRMGEAMVMIKHLAAKWRRDVRAEKATGDVTPQFPRRVRQVL